MIVTLVEKDSLLPKHPLFAGREGGLKDVSFSNKNEFCSFRARYHDTWATQNVRLEDWTELVLFLSKEEVGVLGVELKGLANIRPPH